MAVLGLVLRESNLAVLGFEVVAIIDFAMLVKIYSNVSVCSFLYACYQPSNEINLPKKTLLKVIIFTFYI